MGTAPDVQSETVFRHLPDRTVGARHGFKRDALLCVAEIHQTQFLDCHAGNPVGRVGREVERPQQHAEVVLAQRQRLVLTKRDPEQITRHEPGQIDPVLAGLSHDFDHASRSFVGQRSFEDRLHDPA